MEMIRKSIKLARIERRGSYFQKLKNILILNQKERLNFNLGPIQATVTGDKIRFDDPEPFIISIQAIKYCDMFKKTVFRDFNDFTNTAGYGSNVAHQALMASISDTANKRYITNEFFDDFVKELKSTDMCILEVDSIDLVFEKLFEIKKYLRFKF